MKKKVVCDTMRTSEIMMEIKRYGTEHPGSPAAVRHPRVTARGKIYVALLGPDLSAGIAGFGGSVTSALAAFDRQYQIYLRPTPAFPHLGDKLYADVLFPKRRRISAGESKKHEA